MLTGRWAHEQRSKTHKARLALINANKFARPIVCAPATVDPPHTMSNVLVYQKPFAESWAYANILKDELKAASYGVQPYAGSFKSCRPQYMATFLSADRKVIARRIGMELVSMQSGAPYRVFSRQEWVD